MGLFKNSGQSKSDTKAAATKLKNARTALNANTDTTETDEYLRLNGAVIDAEQNVPWIRR